MPDPPSAINWPSLRKNLARRSSTTQRGVELTEAGRVFHAHATAILRQVEDAKASVRNAEGEPSSRSSSAFHTAPPMRWRCPLLQAVRRELPKVELEITRNSPATSCRSCAAGRSASPCSSTTVRWTRFQATPLLDERLSLIGAASLAGRPKKAVSLKQALAASHPAGPPARCAADHRGSGAPPWPAAAERRRRHQLGQHPAHDAAGGDGLHATAVMPLQLDIVAGSLCAVPVERPALTRRLMMCASKHIPLSAASVAVARLAVSLAKELW